MKSDFLVIGTGLAGLTSAITLSGYGNVLLVTKEKFTCGSSSLAQGGIAAAVGRDDSFKLHTLDTLTAGVHHNNLQAVKFLVENGPAAISWLEAQGVRFDRDGAGYSLGLEAAHSGSRILHITDFTGLALVKKLTENVRRDKKIKIIENCSLIDLIIDDDKCFGASLLYDNKIIPCYSKIVILATGGLGQVYAKTTNPLVSTGDGIAAAARAGARIKDLEFIQFHPTALDQASSPLFLISESLRGEGAVLLNQKGERFMRRYDNRLELAPRDVISRAVYIEQKRAASAHPRSPVFLDIRHLGKEFLQKRFPNIFACLLRLNLDMSKDLIPVTPAAHYSCGGVVTDKYGRTSIDNLFAFGEVSDSGVHGANRLASNSLLEAVVFPLQLRKIIPILPSSITEKPFKMPAYSPSLKFKNITKQLKQLMWEKAGVIRTRKDLQEALVQIKKWEKEICAINEINKQFLTQKNMLTTSRLIVESAIKRKKSLGAHYIMDF